MKEIDNEWHYPSKGEYPKDETKFKSYVVAYYGAKGSPANGKPCWEELCYDTENKLWLDKVTLEDIPYVNQEGIVIAWKEIVLPSEGEIEQADKSLKAAATDFNEHNEWHEIVSKRTPKGEISEKYMPKNKEKVLLKYHFSGDDEIHISDGYYDVYDSEFHIANNPEFRIVCVLAWREFLKKESEQNERQN